MFANSDDFPMKLEVEAGMNPQFCPPVSVGFGMAPAIDQMKTAEAGHEIYRDEVFVKIAIPGDRSSLYFQPATDSHKKRFPHAWADFQKREAGQKVKEGLPVTHWAAVSRSMALNLMTFNISTVEDLAVVHDGLVDKIPGGREMRAKAIAFVSQAKDTAAIMKATSANAELQKQITALQNQIVALQAGHVAKAGSSVPVTTSPQIDEALHEKDILDDVAAAARRPRRSA